MMLLGALAVLMTAAAPADARGNAPSAPPCHETAMAHAGSRTPSPVPAKAAKGMDCCVACVAAPALRSPERARVVAPRPTPAAPPATVPAGERPAPEPHPPRAAVF